MDIISKLVKCAKENPQRIVLPEGTEERTMRAADRAIADGMAHIILIGNPTEILELAEKYGARGHFRDHAALTFRVERRDLSGVFARMAGNRHDGEVARVESRE